MVGTPEILARKSPRLTPTSTPNSRYVINCSKPEWLIRQLGRIKQVLVGYSSSKCTPFVIGYIYLSQAEVRRHKLLQGVGMLSKLIGTDT